MSPAARPADPSVLRLAAPLVVSFWMRAGVTFVDTIYAALVGDPAVAAIGLTVPFEFVMIAIWVGLSTGVTSSISRAMGERQGARVEQYVATCWRLVWTAAPALTVVGAIIWFVAPRLELAPAVARSFQIYGTVLVGGSAFTVFWSIIPDSLVKAHQDTRSTMWAGILTNVINLTLNTVFLFVLHWGVFGIALSTVLSRIGGLAYALYRARWHERRRRAAAAEWGTELDPAPYRAILGLAIPSSLTFILMAVETAFLNRLLAGTEHATEAIAAYSIYFRVLLLALQPAIASAVALLPFAARRLGAGDVAGVRRGLRQLMTATGVYCLAIVGPALYFGAPWISARLAESTVAVGYTTFALRMLPLICLASSLFIICRPAFEAMNRGRPGLAMAVLRYVVLTLPLAWLGARLAPGLGYPPLYGVIISLLLAAATTAVIFLGWLRAALPDPSELGR